MRTVPTGVVCLVGLFVHDWFACSFEVTDESGRTVLVLPFGDAIPDGSDTET
jgi:hypothetical protein